MKKNVCFLVLAVVFFFISVGQAFCQDQSEKWEAMRAASQESSTDDLRGKSDWHDLSRHPVSFPKTSTTSSSGCYSVATGNNITVTASDGSIVNVEADQSNDGSTVSAECNDMDKQENNY